MIPFTAPKDYPEMLNKIGIFTLAGALILTWAIAQANPAIGTLLLTGSFKIPVLGVNLPPLFVVPGLLIAILFRVIKLHDRVSDLFGIRRDFDLHEILIPLAGGVGLTTPLPRLRAFRSSRNELMDKVFYRYAGSSEPKIPQHYIIMALDTWTWFWIITELEVISILSVFVLLFSEAFAHAALLLALMWLGLLAMYLLRCSCARHAHTEVELILEQKSRQEEIKATFNALQDSRS